MLLGLLLVLAGSVAMDPPPASSVKRTPDVESGPGTRADLAEQKFRVLPLQVGSIVRPAPLRLLQPFELIPTRTLPERGFSQLRNKRTGALCTLLILPVSPSLDSQILANPTTDPRDPIVRNDLSACTK
jgi:hypothetical protein